MEQNGELRRRLEKTLSLDVGSPTFEGGLGGRTALEQYRNTNVGKFIQHVNEVGSFALSRGPDVAQFFAGSLLLADLEVLWAAPALTVDEARRRALVEHMLSDHGFLESISGTEEWNEKARRDLISLVLRSGVDTTSQELLRRSGEMPRQKAAVQDDDE